VFFGVLDVSLAQEIPKTVLRGWRGRHFWHNQERKKEREREREKEFPGQKDLKGASLFRERHI